MKNKHFIEVSKICPTRTLKIKFLAVGVDTDGFILAPRKCYTLSLEHTI